MTLVQQIFSHRPISDIMGLSELDAFFQNRFVTLHFLHAAAMIVGTCYNLVSMFGAELLVPGVCQFFKVSMNITKRLVPAYNVDFYQAEIQQLFLSYSEKKWAFSHCHFDNNLFDFRVTVKGEFDSCSFVGAKFDTCKITGIFNNCTFNDASFEKCTFERAIFRNCKFIRTKFSKSMGYYTSRFYNSCNFEKAKGLEISGPYTDDGVFEIRTLHSKSAVPSYISPEKTEKMPAQAYYESMSIDTTDSNDYEDEDDYSGCWAGLAGLANLGRYQGSGLGPVNRNIPSKPYRTKAVLVCSKEGMV